MIVVDTNVLAYRVVSHPATEKAKELSRLEPEWASPLLWRSELRNVISGYLRRGQLTTREAREAMQMGELCLLGGEYAVDDEMVFNLVERSKCTAYDCEFVALAMTLGVPLVTEDRALMRDFPECCSSIQAFLGAKSP